jgi:hypothetical protein
MASSLFIYTSEHEFVNLSRSAQESIPSLAGRYEGPPGYIGWQNRFLAESIPWNRFQGSLNVYKYGLRGVCVLY